MAADVYGDRLMAKALMVQGTCSGAGKSLLVAGLARYFANKGIKVAPFKAQNMALNSFITREGAEIGRAQALQAESAKIAPHVDMNPVLLKASGEMGCQVILDGTVHSSMTAKEYYKFKDTAWKTVQEGYARLSARYDLILIEGAGSPAEINLQKEEIVNMRVARHTGCPVLLVGDIERGGVFASFKGTVDLVGDDAKYLKAFIINKFRGDKDILDPGLKMIQDSTGIPTVGVLPWMPDTGLDEEDGLGLADFKPTYQDNALRIVVVRLGYISNFTDFDPLRHEPGVELLFSSNPSEIENAHMLIIPGTKNTVTDLNALKKKGLDRSIIRAAKKGIPVVGICGGYQMLGMKILDPKGVESEIKETTALGLLDTVTNFEGQKVTAQCEASTNLYGYTGRVKGYEIHMGRTVTAGDTGAFNLTRLNQNEPISDGAIKDNVWGTYMHGVFDDDGFRHAMLTELRKRYSLPVPASLLEYQLMREINQDRWAEFLATHLDMKFIESLI
jgi:adenosylcobyric acid synthase